MAGTLKINEEIDRISKKLASMKQVQKAFPNTVLIYQGMSADGPTYRYESVSVNKQIDTIHFRNEKSWAYVYCYKQFGTIELYSDPNRFGVFQYYPDSLFKDLILQNYRENMLKANIAQDIIKKVDLWVIDFIARKNIALTNSNINDGSFEELKKLLILK